MEVNLTSTQLNNKHVLVTGATSGIGKDLVFSLLERGAKVSFCGRSTDKLTALVNTLEPDTDKTYYQAFDLSDFNQIVCFTKSAIEQLGDIDILINCAGANSARAKVNEIELTDLQSMLNVNMLAPFVFMKEVYNQSMLAKKAGMIINVLSTVCLYSNEGIGAYTASKSGFDALTKVFRKEAREAGVKVCAIYPGGVDTPFRQADRPEYLATSDVVQAILLMVQQADNAAIDELVVRPMVEKNF